jgi:ABC-2 type transport system permease protein
MFAEFKHTLRKKRGALIGWGIGLFLYGFMMSSFYSNIKEIGDQMEMLLSSYPPELLAFFPTITEFATPVGYLDTYFFAYMPLIIGIFTIGTGAGLLVSDEEKGILDLVMAHPISRGSLFWGRVLGYLMITILIMLVGWIGWLIPAEKAGLTLSAFEILTPYLPLLANLLIFGSLALLLSMVLPSVRMAGGLTGGLLVANFLLVGISNINPDFQPLYELTPFYFTQGAKAIEGMDWAAFAGLMGVSILFILIAWWRFQRRDIRVGGEGGWGTPSLRKLLRRESGAL